MTRQVLDWLPLAIVTREPLRAKLETAVAAWAEAWFSKPRLHATRLASVRSGDTPAGQGGGWRIPGQALAISCPRRAAARLVDWALDADAQRLSATDVDRGLIDGFETRIFEDMAAQIERALGAESRVKPDPAVPFGALGGLSAEIADDQGETLVWLALPLDALVSTCKASLSPAARSSEKLTGLRSAMAAVPVSIDAVLGSAKIGLADLQTLAPGDVLVLDTALEEAVSLALSGADRRIGRAVLNPGEDALSLILQA